MWMFNGKCGFILITRYLSIVGIFSRLRIYRNSPNWTRYGLFIFNRWKKKSNPLITACNVSRAILIPKLRYFNFIHIPYHELRQINAFTQLHCIGNYFYLHLGKSHNGVCVTQHNNVWPPRFCSTNKFHGNQMTMAISMVNCRDVYCFYIFLYMHWNGLTFINHIIVDPSIFNRGQIFERL